MADELMASRPKGLRLPGGTRRWRIATGLVMWTYMALHMLNHSLGLWSLAHAERAMKMAVSLVHAWPVTVLLYGAFSIHLALAIIGLARRPTLWLGWAESLRIALGLGFPLMLIGHVFATRLSHEWFALAPEYGRVVAGLIASGNEGRQLALLAPGWAHGCLGLDLSLKARPALRPWRPVFFALALLLPVLAGAGFLAMEREVGQLLGDPQWRSHLQSRLPAEQAAWMQTQRGLVTDAYLGVIVLTLVLHFWRRGRRPTH